jgi:hypothetical protein
MQTTPAQCRAARALVNLSLNDLARLGVVQAITVWDFEAGIGLTRPVDIDAMQTVLENAGVEFIERRVRLTK